MSHSEFIRYGNAMNYLLATLGSISALMSLAVVLTFISFSSMRKRHFMRIIAIMSFCDFIMGVTNTFNFVPYEGLDGEPQTKLCLTQSILYCFFARALAFWMLVMAYQLHAVVSQKFPPMSELQMNFVGWVLPSLFTLSVILSQTNFQRSRSRLITVCFIETGAHEGQAENIGIFVLNTIVVYLLTVVPIIYIYVQIRSYVNTNSNDDERILIGVKSLYIYPICMPICYLPVSICGLFYYSSSFHNKNALYAVSFCYLLFPIYGILVATVFFCKSEAARYHWKQIFYNKEVDILAFEELSNKDGDSSFVDDAMSNRLSLGTQNSRTRSQITNSSSSGLEYKDNRDINRANFLDALGGFTRTDSERISLSSKLIVNRDSEFEMKYSGGGIDAVMRGHP